MHEVNGVKQKFLAGLEKYDGRTFDPAEHCEWFSELPETWQVSVAGRDVVMRSALHGTTSFESPALVQLLERERATDFVPFSRLRLRSNALATKLASAYQVARCSGADWG
ncbi:MAG: hypothetical protein Q8K63_14355 [Acidimicrobiales bacterium]|nr:hypothetical protein [Acidimicrobiales bacterium]